MNWKKILLVSTIGAVSGSAANWVNSGGSYAFTAGNILIPAAGALLPTLMALFMKSPQQPSSTPPYSLPKS